ncbi:MAG TPA: DUF4157 domain-containing protein, partial [Kofleriaceae bacterium]|nr:DUF4157 domain-containing protein [Kofleriaceae bacterium]
MTELQGANRKPRPASPGKVALTDSLPAEPAPAEGGAGDGAQDAGQDASSDAVADAAAAGGGEPLPDDVRARFERSLGVDLAGVRIHTDPAAASAAATIGARAYTIGQDIYFAAGQYDPRGDRLLAHEVAHTVQQRGGSPALQPKLAISSPTDALELEADRAADSIVGGDRATVSAASGGAARQVFRWQTASGTPRQENVISPDGFLIQGNNIQVERVWYEQRYRRHRTDENRKILAALAAGEMPWINDLPAADLTLAATNLRLEVTFDEGHDLATVPIRNNVMVWVGLPPGTDAFWDFPAGERPADAAPDAPRPRRAMLYVRASEYQRTAPDGRQFSVRLMTEIADRLEAAVGASLLPGVRDQVIADGQLLPRGASPRAKGLALPHSREVMVSLFGEGAWAAYEQRSHT